MGLEGDSTLVERPSGDFLAARELFDFLLVQLAVLVALAHGHKALALQPSQRGACRFCVLLPVSPANHTHRGNLGVVTKHGFDGVEQGRFSVPGGLAVEDEHTFLIRHTQKGIAQRSLQEVSLVLVPLCNLLNEGLPALALHVTGDGVPESGLHGEKVFPIMLPERVVPEVVCTVETVYQVRVSVKLHSVDTKLASSVLENPVSHAAVSHLIHKAGVGLP